MSTLEEFCPSHLSDESTRIAAMCQNPIAPSGLLPYRFHRRV